MKGMEKPLKRDHKKNFFVGASLKLALVRPNKAIKRRLNKLPAWILGLLYTQRQLFCLCVIGGSEGITKGREYYPVVK